MLMVGLTITRHPLDNMRFYVDFVGVFAMGLGAALLWRRFKVPLARMLQLS
jgi:hypothetical protein